MRGGSKTAMRSRQQTKACAPYESGTTNQGLRSLRVRHNKPRLALLTSQAQQMVVPPVNAVLNMFMAQRLILAFLFIACKSKSAYLDI